ncbi:MAG: glycosyltransferase family 4 protein, partial [Rhodospirillales bacterium]
SGGGVTYLRNVMPLFGLNPNLDVHLIIHEDQRDLYLELGDGVHVHTRNFSSGFYGSFLWEQVTLPLFAKIINADVVFSPGNYGPFILRKQVTLLRNALDVGRTEQRLRRRVLWFSISLVTWISLIFVRRAIAVSHYAAESIAPRWTRHKIDVVHHGVSEKFRVATNTESIQQDRFFLMVSDIYVQKNFQTVIDALSSVKKQHPNVKLRVAGKVLDPVYYDLIQAQIQRLDLSDNIEFLGSQPPDEIKKLYASCRALVFSSTVEAFGNPLLEAMASGCPVLSSNTTAMPEVAGDAVLYFAPDDVAGLAELMGSVLTDDALCTDLSQRAIKRSQDFSWSKTAEQTAKILIKTAQR